MGVSVRSNYQYENGSSYFPFNTAGRASAEDQQHLTALKWFLQLFSCCLKSCHVRACEEQAASKWMLHDCNKLKVLRRISNHFESTSPCMRKKLVLRENRCLDTSVSRYMHISESISNLNKLDMEIWRKACPTRISEYSPSLCLTWASFPQNLEAEQLQMTDRTCTSQSSQSSHNFVVNKLVTGW